MTSQDETLDKAILLDKIERRISRMNVRELEALAYYLDTQSLTEEEL